MTAVPVKVVPRCAFVDEVEIAIASAIIIKCQCLFILFSTLRFCPFSHVENVLKLTVGRSKLLSSAVLLAYVRAWRCPGPFADNAPKISERETRVVASDFW